MARTSYTRQVASLIVFFAAWFLMSECGLFFVQKCFGSLLLLPKNKQTLQEIEKPKPPPGTKSDDRSEMMMTISDHCLPKLVCELYAKPPETGMLADSEKNLMAIIGSSSLTSITPSKYHHASFIGQLIQGLEGQGCHHFYPICPFSGEEIQEIARKVILK